VFLRNHPAEKGLKPVGENEAECLQRTNDSSAPSLNWKLVCKSRLLWQLAAIYCSFGFSYIIYSTFFVRHLVKDGGFTPGGAGALWMQIGMISMISGFIWGSISDRWGRRMALLCVFTLQGVSFAVFGLSSGRTAVYFSSALFALTAWSIPALMAALAGDVFGARLAPAALGLMTIVFGIGQAIGPYFAGAVADATQSFSTAFVIAGIVALVFGAGSSLFLQTTKGVT
jgi:predicted MFS family arabinose efflux permease